MGIKNIFLFFLVISTYTSLYPQSNPVLYTRNIENLEQNAAAIKNGSPKLSLARKQLLATADNIIKASKTYSVTTKKELAPSGDIHDFYSMAKYWWPNPQQPDGKPFIRKDGKPYPGRKDAPDSDMLSNLGKDVYRLGLAYYFTQNEIYAQHVKKLISIFFLNPATKMNPNFEYAQVILGKGNSDGSIVSANPFIEVIEGIQLIQGSKALTAQDEQALKTWFRSFLDWMLTSKIGQKQRRAKNNIGTFYTTQAATYALFTGNTKLAKQILEEDAPKRISDQIDSKGKLPEELKRAKPWSYVKYDLDAFKRLVEVASKVDLDLWNYQTENGGSIQKAFDWLLPFASGKKKWPYKQPVTRTDFQSFLKKSGFYTSSTHLQKGKVSYLSILENKH